MHSDRQTLPLVCSFSVGSVVLALVEFFFKKKFLELNMEYNSFSEHQIDGIIL